MGIRERLSGNEAVAYAMKQINPDVMGAYPITPSTEIPQYFSAYVDNGEVDTEFIAVESEHSAMSTCIGAEAAGCRAISATSSCGLRQMGDFLRDKEPNVVAVLASINGEKISFLAVCGKEAVARGVKAGELVKTVCAVCGGKGGGKPDSAMGGGSDLLKLDDALASVDDFVTSKLG